MATDNHSSGVVVFSLLGDIKIGKDCFFAKSIYMKST